MAHHHHHHQLTAHSQLTTLSPGQIHYIQQLPTSILSPANIYQDNRNRTNQNTFLRTAYEGHYVESDVCLICLQSLYPRLLRCGKSPLEVFSKACELLQVPINEIQHEWNFFQNDKMPFCSACTELMQGLITLHEQLSAIQGRLNEGLNNIRRIIQETNNGIPINDPKTINFRSKAMRYGNSISNIPLCHKPSANSNGGNTNIAATDFAYLLNTPISNIVPQNYSMVHETTMREQHYVTPISSQSIGYSSVEPSHSSGQLCSTIFPSTHAAFNTASTCEIDNISFSKNPNLSEGQEANYTIDADITDGGNDFFEDDEDDSYSNSGTSSESDYEEDNRLENESISQEKSEEYTPPPVIEPSPPKRTKNRHNSSTFKKTEKSREGAKRQSNEYFPPIQTDEHGKMTFEGIEISQGDSGYICGQCGAQCGKGLSKTSIRKVKIHIKGVHLGAYNCTVCNKKFTSNDILSQHTVRTHLMAEIPCDICLRPIKPRYMNAHKFTHMNAEEKEIYIATGFKPPVHNKNSNKSFECSMCKKTFKKRTDLHRHKKSHLDTELRKDHKCHVCNRAYTSTQALREHVMVQHDKVGHLRKKMCKICGKTMTPKALRKHLKIHVPKEDRPHVCQICGARLGNRRSLRIHEEAHGPDETPDTFNAECDVCGKMFKTFQGMRNHRRKTHKNHCKLVPPATLVNEVSTNKPDKNGSLE